MDHITQCANWLVGLEPNSHNKEKRVRKQVHACCMKRNSDTLLTSLTATRQVEEMAKRCTPSHLTNFVLDYWVKESQFQIAFVPKNFNTANCSTGPITVRAGIAPTTVKTAFSRGREYSRHDGVNPPKPSSISG